MRRVIHYTGGAVRTSRPDFIRGAFGSSLHVEQLILEPAADLESDITERFQRQ